MQPIKRIELKVLSLVLELTGTRGPADGLQAKCSVYHGCAAARGLAMTSIFHQPGRRSGFMR